MRSHSASAMTNGNSAANWPGPAFRSAGVLLALRFEGPALLTFSSTGQTVELAQRMPAAGSDEETFYVVGSYPYIGTRANMAVVCRAGG